MLTSRASSSRRIVSVAEVLEESDSRPTATPQTLLAFMATAQNYAPAKSFQKDQGPEQSIYLRLTPYILFAFQDKWLSMMPTVFSLFTFRLGPDACSFLDFMQKLQRGIVADG